MHRREFLTFAALAGGLPTSGRALGSPRTLPDSFSLHGTLSPETPLQHTLAAGPPAAILLYCLAPQQLLGWPFQLSAAAAAELMPAVRALPHLGRLSGRGSTLPLEKLLALSPDLIVDTGTINDLYRSGAERTAQQTWLPYLLIDGNITLSASTFLHLGKLLGVAERGKALAAFAQQILDAAESHRQQTLATAPSFYLARGADGLETATSGSIHGQALELCGWRNVVPPLGGSGLGRISLEQLLAWDPDYLLTHDPVLHDSAQRSSTWRSLRAVRENRYLLVPSLPFGWLDQPPGVNRLLGVHWVTQSLQAGATRHATREALRDACQRLYQHPPSDPLLDLALQLTP